MSRDEQEEMATRPGVRRNETGLLHFSCIAAIVLIGALDAWITRNGMNADANAYLAIADSIAAGDWMGAVNAYRSPLYPFVLALVSSVFKPSPVQELAVAHVANLLCFLGSMAAFSFLLEEADAVRSDDHGSPSKREYIVVAWSFFLFASVGMIGLGPLTPDMLVLCFFCLEAALLLRWQRTRRAGSLLTLGFVVALGYLAKTILLYVGAAFIAAPLLFPPRPRLRVWVVSATLCVLTAAPYASGLLAKYQRFTVGDAGKLAYAQMVNHTFFWHGTTADTGTPVHPRLELSSSPQAYAFMETGHDFDPAYWAEGLRVRFDLGNQIRAIVRNARMWFDIFFRHQSGFVVLLALLFAGGRSGFLAIRPFVLTLLPALVGMSMYTLVLVSPRFVAAFVLILALALLAGVRLPLPGARRRILLLTAVFLVLPVVLWLISLARNADGGPAPRDWPVSVALSDLGIRSGDTFASLGELNEAQWPRLSRIRSIALVPDHAVQKFWGDREGRERVLREFRKIGVRFVAAENPPLAAKAEGWTRLADSDYWAFVFDVP